jgi:PmbA protein
MSETPVTNLAPPSSATSGAQKTNAGPFPLPTGELERIAQSVLAQAKAGGATAAETDVSQATGLSVSVRKGEVETIAYNRDKGIGITVYIGQRRGHSSSADFSDAAVSASVQKALAIAR